MFPNLIPYFYNLSKLRSNHWRNPSELKKLQEVKLKSLLRHAYHKVDYYRYLLVRSGIKPEDIKNSQDLTKIPITSRKEIQALPEEKIIAKNVNLAECFNLRTSGSTGMPLDIWISQKECRIRKKNRFKVYLENGYNRKDKILHIIPFDNHLKEKKLWIQYFALPEDRYVSILENDIEEKLELIKEFKPDIIRGFASSVKSLALLIEEKQIVQIHPRVVFSVAELLVKKDREFISSVFQADVIDYYSANECGVIAWECREHAGYHIDADNVIVEFIKENGERAKAGEEGEIVITSLNSYTMPFIRYKLGDIGVPSDERCPCGRSLPLINTILGRINDYIILPTGKKISPYVLMVTMDKIPEVKRYQIIQESEDKIRIKILQSEMVSMETAIKISKIYKEILGSDIKVEPIIVNKQLWVNPGKFKVIFSKIGDDNAN